MPPNKRVISRNMGNTTTEVSTSRQMALTAWARLTAASWHSTMKVANTKNLLATACGGGEELACIAREDSQFKMAARLTR